MVRASTSFTILYKKQQRHDGCQNIPDIQVDIAVLYPAQAVEQPQDRPDNQPAHVQFGNVTDMAVVMGLLWKTPLDGRVVFVERGYRLEEFQDRSRVGRSGVLHLDRWLGEPAAPGAGAADGFAPVGQGPQGQYKNQNSQEQERAQADVVGYL